MSESMYCAVNPAAGKEGEFKLNPSERAKRVMVVGGGPGGMEAAKVAALRGHQVTLYEKGRHLGGSLVFASVLTRENEDLLNYLVTQIRKLPVKVKLGEEVTPELIKGINPEATILAVGASLASPQIPGADRPNVISGANLRQIMSGRLEQDTATKLAWWQRVILSLGSAFLKGFKPSTIRWLTKLWMPLGKKVAIIGSDFVACELAQFLVERGRKVVILGSGQQMATELAIPSRWILMDSLLKSGVTMLTEVKCEEITAGGVVITNKEAERQMIEADTVVFAEGIEANPELFQAIEGKGWQIYRAGDCQGPGLIKGAIADGATTALTI